MSFIVLTDPITLTDSTNQRLDQIRESRELLREKLENTETQQEACEKQLTMLERVRESVERFETQHQNWLRSSSEELNALDLAPDQLAIVKFTYETVLDGIREKLIAQETNLGKLRLSIKAEEAKLTDEEQKITAGLQESTQLYQRYKTEIANWEYEKRELQQAIDELRTTIKSLKEEYPKKHALLKTEREKVVSQIFLQKLKLTEVYGTLYKPVQDFIKEHPLVKNKYRLCFEVSIDIQSNFVDEFFKRIRQDTRGTFRGKDVGQQNLLEIVEGRNFADENDLKKFLEQMLYSLTHDERGGTNERVTIESQLRNISLTDFYDFLFGLEYLQPRYSLQLDGKELPQLSPGERGILLLIFYLLIDNDDCPLIIDQPEENLDNQSVFELLVPCVEEAKARRQIFMVTHNPNLAVVCNADQVINTHIDKIGGNRVSYVTGSIENPDMNKRIVDILEGTWRAFRKREAMYQLIPR